MSPRPPKCPTRKDSPSFPLESQRVNLKPLAKSLWCGWRKCGSRPHCPRPRLARVHAQHRSRAHLLRGDSGETATSRAQFSFVVFNKKNQLPVSFSPFCSFFYGFHLLMVDLKKPWVQNLSVLFAPLKCRTSRFLSDCPSQLPSVVSLLVCFSCCGLTASSLSLH